MKSNFIVICWWLLLLAACDQQQAAPPPLDFAAVLGVNNDPGFKQAVAVRDFSFPDDHGAHPDYRIEWWYFTGNLATPDGREFGYQFTLFRNAITAADNGVQSGKDSNWRTSQVYMAHATLSDVATGGFHHDEQFSRGALGLAGVTARPLRLWLQQWSVASQVDQCRDCLTVEITVAARDFRMQLQLNNTRSPVLHGDHGLSAKSINAGDASYYYSYTRIQTNGQIVLGENIYPVSGASWFDHEWSSSALASGQQGWDWFGLQLADQTEIMIYRLRSLSATGRDFFSGSLVHNGGLRILAGEEIGINAINKWRSPATGVTYPSAWEVAVPGYRMTITPKMPDQELNASFRYWDGAVRIRGDAAGQPVTGQGYVELTGYR